MTHECVACVTPSGARAYGAVTWTSEDGKTVTVATLARGEDDAREYFETGETFTCDASSVRVVEATLSQRKERRAIDPHGERAVDCYTIDEAGDADDAGSGG